MASSNEISLIIGLIVSGLFFIQYKRYEAQLKKEEMLESFLEKNASEQPLTANA